MAVLGNHDFWARPERIADAFAEAGVQLLINRALHLPPPHDDLAIVGLDDPLTGRAAADTVAPVADVPHKLAICHSPDGLDAVQGTGVSLLVTGHTHGGAICLPGYRPIVMPSRAGRLYPYGRHQIGRPHAVRIARRRREPRAHAHLGAARRGRLHGPLTAHDGTFAHPRSYMRSKGGVSAMELLVLLALGLAAFVVLPLLLLKLVLFVVLLPFKILGLVFKVLFGVVGVVGSVLMAVVGAVFSVLAVAFVVLLIPLLPLVVIGAGIWLVARAARPQADGDPPRKVSNYYTSVTDRPGPGLLVFSSVKRRDSSGPDLERQALRLGERLVLRQHPRRRALRARALLVVRAGRLPPPLLAQRLRRASA